MPAIREITPAECDALLKSTDAPQLIDVREPWEFAAARVEGAQLMPLGGIRDWALTLDKSLSLVVMCHHGARSAMACQYLQSLGFSHVQNLAGGIHAWSLTVDLKIPRY